MKSSPRIKEAIAVATKAHEGQLRKTGEPYIIHPLAVMKILQEWNMDEDTIIAGILHDTVEDTDLSLKEIEDTFGKDVAFLVGRQYTGTLSRLKASIAVTAKERYRADGNIAIVSVSHAYMSCVASAISTLSSTEAYTA